MKANEVIKCACGKVMHRYDWREHSAKCKEACSVPVTANDRAALRASLKKGSYERRNT